MAKGVYYTKHLDLTQTKGVYEQPVENWDFLYKASTTKDSRFDIGDRVCLSDGRVFRYAKAGANFDSMKVACCTYGTLICEYSTATAVLTAAAAIGDRSVGLTVTAATVGVSRDGVIAEDELRGGYITIYGSTTYRPTRGITGNTALAADGTTFTVYLDAALTTACATSSITSILPNPYRDVRSSNAASGMSGWLGIPNVLATSGQYFWVQTWGLARISPVGAAVGANTIRQFMFASNGGVRGAYASVVTQTASEQHAGFLMENCNGNEAEDAAPFINLQINP